MENRSSIFSSKKFPTTMSVVLILYIVAEILTRLIFRPQVVPEAIYTKYSPFYDYGFSEDMPLFYENGDKLVLYPTPYLAFWKQEMDSRKPGDVFRIFTIGSSVSRGDLNVNYSSFLEKYLNETGEQKNFEVINCSATGIGSARMVLIFQKILKYKPDLVIFHLHGSNEFEDERDFAEAQKLKSSKEGIIRKSWFFCVAKKYADEKIFKKFKAKENVDAETYARWFVPGKRNEWMEMLRQNTGKIVDIAEKNDLPVVFVNRVFRNEEQTVFEDQETIELNAITQEFQQENVTIIDTPHLFMETFGPHANQDQIFLDTVHLKSSGHRIIAEEILKVVKSRRS